MDAVAGFEDGAVGAEKNLIRAAARFEGNVAEGAVTAMVVSLYAKRSNAGAGVPEWPSLRVHCTLEPLRVSL